MKVKKKFSDEIVSIKMNTTSYCDDQYYKTKMLEDRDNEKYKNYPVNIWALQVDWILNGDEGRALLEKILNSENFELYECMPI